MTEAGNDFNGLDDPADLTGPISRALHGRAAVVTVHDRLDDITGRQWSVGDRGPGRPGPAGRLLVAAAVVVLAAAGTVALVQRGGDETVQATGPDATSAIYPVLGDLSDATGIDTFEPLIQRSIDTADMSTRLTLGRRTGAEATDIVQVVVTPAPDPTTSTPATQLPFGEPRIIGNREVTVVPADPDQADLVVWLDPAVTAAEIAEVERFLAESLTVASSLYIDQDATYAQFQLYYLDQPEVVDLVEPGQLPTSFQVQLEIVDVGLAAALGDEIEGLPGVSQVASAADWPEGAAPTTDRYLWDEAGASVTVLGEGAEEVVAALVLTPGPGLPALSVGELPDGLEPLAGPSAPGAYGAGLLPRLDVMLPEGPTVHVTVEEFPSLPLVASYAVVPVGAVDGFQAVVNGQVFLAWPLAGTPLWVTLSTTGLDADQTRRLADGLTFTDRDTWEGRYPEPSVVDTTIFATEVTEDGAGSGDTTAGDTTPTTTPSSVTTTGSATTGSATTSGLSGSTTTGPAGATTTSVPATVATTTTTTTSGDPLPSPSVSGGPAPIDD